MKSFFKVKTVDEVLSLIGEFSALDVEEKPLSEAAGRVLGEDIRSGEDIPSFDRSSMDGYAVRARDTFGSTETLPGLFQVVGEVRMGEAPDLRIGPSETVRIWTGGMLPQGADAVVMLEYARLVDETTVELCRPAAPLENVISRGEDVRKDQQLMARGHRLRAQDLGLLAAMGRGRVNVHRRPRAAILSTGDEIVPVDQVPGPGQVRDINSYTLAAQVASAGGEPLILGLVPDDFEGLRSAVQRGVSEAEVVLISGGSSVGVRDFTIDALSSLPGSEILVHGVSVSPGKPTIMARLGNQSVWGLPGHAVSAMITADLFVRPLLARLGGQTVSGPPWGRTVSARLARNLPSVHGRQDYVRVRLEQDGDLPLAHPILGKSGLISTMVKADGIVCVGLNEEGLPKGASVEVMVF